MPLKHRTIAEICCKWVYRFFEIFFTYSYFWQWKSLLLSKNQWAAFLCYQHNVPNETWRFFRHSVWACQNPQFFFLLVIAQRNISAWYSNWSMKILWMTFNQFGCKWCVSGLAISEFMNDFMFKVDNFTLIWRASGWEFGNVEINWVLMTGLISKIR